MHRILISVAAALAAFGAISSAQAAVQDENMLLPLIAGFKVGAKSAQGPVEISEFVPSRESVEAWSQMVTQQTFHGLSNVAPDKLPATMIGSWQQACPGGTAQKIREEVENGYPASIWAFTCPLNPQAGKPENMWVKTISGSDALYSVQYAIRSDVTVAATQTALTYLQRATVCDTRRLDRPCPQATAEGPPTASPIATFLRAADANDFAAMRAVMDRGSPRFFQDISKCYLRQVFSNDQTHEIAATWMCAEGPNRSRVVVAGVALTPANKVSVSAQQITNDKPAPPRTGPAFQ